MRLPKAPPWWVIFLIFGSAYNLIHGHWKIGLCVAVITLLLYWKTR